MGVHDRDWWRERHREPQGQPAGVKRAGFTGWDVLWIASTVVGLWWWLG